MLFIRRLANVIVVSLSYFFSLLIKKPLVWGFPWAISIEPLNYCNLRCPECIVGAGNLQRKQQKMDLTAFRTLLEKLPPSIFYLQLYFQGEPLLHPDFPEMVRLAKKRGMLVATSTNAQNVTENAAMALVRARLDRIIISLDGIDSKSYAAYRTGGNLEKVKQSIHYLVKAKQIQNKRRPIIEIQTLVTSKNEHDLDAIRKVTRNWGANRFTPKILQINNGYDTHKLLPENARYNKYQKRNNGKLQLRYTLKNRCKRLWSHPVIGVSGDVYPCCYDKQGSHAMGNLHEHSFQEIWKSKAFQTMRKTILTHRKQVPMCLNCTEGLAE